MTGCQISYLATFLENASQDLLDLIAAKYGICNFTIVKGVKTMYELV
jgi:hypothetical protein